MMTNPVYSPYGIQPIQTEAEREQTKRSLNDSLHHWQNLIESAGWGLFREYIESELGQVMKTMQSIDVLTPDSAFKAAVAVGLLKNVQDLPVRRIKELATALGSLEAPVAKNR